MNFFKTSILSGMTTLVRILTGFISVKFIAVYVGPAGFAIIGQFQNMVQIIQTFAGSMISSGVVKYVAEYHNEPEKKERILGSALAISLVSSGIISALLLIFRQQLAREVLKNVAYSNIIVLLAATLFLFVLNTLLFAILNGERDIKRYTLGNIITIVFGLLITVVMAVTFHVSGVLIAIVINQSVVVFLTLLLIKPSAWIKWLNCWHKADIESLLKLAKFAVMAITTALMLPVIQVILREYIMAHFSMAEAGFWQAITRISDAYLMLITTTLGVYYLPRLAELKSAGEIKKEIFFGYKIILPFVIIIAFSIWLLKAWVIKILYSPAFMPMLPLFKYQLLGDVLKIGSWLLSYLMLAKAMMRLFVLSEIVFSATYAALSIILMHYYGLIGITMAFAINYAVYWIFMGVVFQRYLRKKENG